MRAEVRHIAVTLQGLGDAGPLDVAAGIFAPDPGGPVPRAALFCLPGGGMNRNYFDLSVDGDASYSFARALTAAGFIVVALDPLGVGGSTRPPDGFALYPDLVAEANAQVTEQLMDEFRSGTALADLEALPSLASIGIGHSLGGMLTVLQQAQHRSHDAVALLGFSCNGLPGVLKPEELALAHGAAGPSRADVARLARARFPEPYPEVVATAQGRELFSRAPVDRQAVNALAPARDRLLAVGATLSILPGGVAGECALIDVPLFLGVGDLDFCGPPREIPASFPASIDITLLILPETGHTHFLFPSRRQLFGRLATWASQVADGSRRKE